MCSKDYKYVYASVMPNFDSFLHITNHSQSNYYLLATLYCSTIKPNVYTCYY